MPCYCFQCPVCGEQKDVSRLMRDSDLPEICECGEPMERDWQTERTGVRGNYNRPIISVSMAFNTQDLAEHRRRFPDVELKVDAGGRTAYPVLRSLSQKRDYLRKRGWQDVNSFT